MNRNKPQNSNASSGAVKLLSQTRNHRPMAQPQDLVSRMTLIEAGTRWLGWRSVISDTCYFRHLTPQARVVRQPDAESDICFDPVSRGDLYPKFGLLQPQTSAGAAI